MRQLRQNVVRGQIFGARDGALPRGAARARAKCLENAGHSFPIGSVPAPHRSCPRTAPPPSHDPLGSWTCPFPAALLISLGLIAVAAGIERAMGRLFLFCRCGTFKLWYGGLLLAPVDPGARSALSRRAAAHRHRPGGEPGGF